MQCKLQIHVLHGHVTQQVLLCYSVFDALLSLAIVYICCVASSFLCYQHHDMSAFDDNACQGVLRMVLSC